VSIDDKIVGRVQKGRQEFFRATAGTHALAAATAQGDYWEQKVDVGLGPAFSVSVSFEKVRSDRALLERNVSDLRKQVTEKQLELSRVRANSAQIEATRRHSIVEAINYYTDRWGKEIGMRDSRNEASENLNNVISEQGIANMANTNTAAQAGTEIAMAIEGIMAARLKAKAYRNELAGEAASLRMQYLGKALEDPLKYPPDTADADYLTILKTVRHKKNEGKLITAPNRLEYSDREKAVSMSCATLRHASGKKQLRLTYLSEAKAGKRKPRQQSLVVKAVHKNERTMLLADVYLACPRLTK
jgi:hypothetical protein